MGTPAMDTVKPALAELARATPGLELLILFGSRAREQARPDSDWDFGFLGREELDPDRLLARLVEAVGSDRVDLADLARAGGLLRYRAARDGHLVYEAREGLHDEFRLEAVRFWCDAERILREAYDAKLAEMGQ